MGRNAWVKQKCARLARDACDLADLVLPVYSWHTLLNMLGLMCFFCYSCWQNCFRSTKDVFVSQLNNLVLKIFENNNTVLMFINCCMLIDGDWRKLKFKFDYNVCKLLCNYFICCLLSDGLDGLPEPQSMRVENKMFYFDVGQNRRGVFMRVSEVFNFNLMRLHENYLKSPSPNITFYF